MLGRDEGDPNNFGGTHPGHWEAAIDAYKRGLGRTELLYYLSNDAKVTTFMI